MSEGEEKDEADRCADQEEAALLVSLRPEERERLKLIVELIATIEQPDYGKRQQGVAEQLGITVRTVRRLVRQMREQGVASVVRRSRCDRGAVRISESWQQFIIATYREGNRGSRQLSPAQVAVRVRARAQEIGTPDYPCHMTVYRILQPLIAQGQQPKRTLGWRRDCLVLRTRDGLDIPIEWSNQVWQVDHTRSDVLVVDQNGSLLGRPWLTIVVDTYSRCLMGIHLGFDAPSAAVVCLALRHAILPKQYSSAYELQESWGTYGIAQHLYTDGGKDFREAKLIPSGAQHLEQVAIELGIVLHLRRKPSEGGIVERPFGTLNTQFFSSLPGYVSSNVMDRSAKAETEACLTLQQLEQLLVRYIVDHYNRTIDARMGDQSRIGRWESGRIARLRLLGDPCGICEAARELDNCLMRRDRRVVYRSGYLQFASLTYQGEHLAAYAGESVIIRYDPRDITTIYIYHLDDSKEVFLTRAHAQGWETEILSYKEAQAISQRRREAGKAIDNQSLLSEVRDRDMTITQVQRQKKRKQNLKETVEITVLSTDLTQPGTQSCKSEIQRTSIHSDLKVETITEIEKPKKPVPYVRVDDYEELKRKGGLL
jgi:putative transposase